MRALVKFAELVVSPNGVAVALMVSGVTAAVAGSYLVWGLGPALLTLAALLIALSLMIGWE